MKQETIAVGLDIGTTEIRVLVGRKLPRKTAEILGLGQAPSRGIVGGKMNNIEQVITSLQEAIAKAEEASGIDIRLVNVGISGAHCSTFLHQGSLTRETPGGEVTAEDVARLTHDMYKTVVPPGKKIIHVLPQIYTLDYNKGVRDPVGMSSVKLAGFFQIIMADTYALNSLEKCMSRAGLEIDQVLLAPLATSLAVLSKEEREAGIGLIDLGGETIDLVGFHDSMLCYTATLPLGSQAITDDIRQGCMVMGPQAEQLKLQFGQALAKDIPKNERIVVPGLRNRPPKEIATANLARIIEARMEEFVTLLQRELTGAECLEKLAGGLVLTGGGAKLKLTKQLFEDLTGLDVRLGMPHEYIAPPVPEEWQSMAYSTVIGLMLSSFRQLDGSRYSHNYTAGPLARNGRKKQPQAQQPTKDFLKRIFDRTKGFLAEEQHG